VPRTGRKWVAFFVGPLAFAALLGFDGPLSAWGEYGAGPALAAGLTLWMAIWWISEAVRIEWTACLPLVVLPFANVHGDGFAANLRGALLPYLDPTSSWSSAAWASPPRCSSGTCTAASRWR
jgi:sodium-dependent dicarboxylate transporter 2/3/5